MLRVELMNRPPLPPSILNLHLDERGLGCSAYDLLERLQEGDFHCPCHGSRFAYDGSVLSEPAVLPLKSYAVSFDGTTVVITVG